jgi:hypothetical protein
MAISAILLENVAGVEVAVVVEVIVDRGMGSGKLLSGGSPGCTDKPHKTLKQIRQTTMGGPFCVGYPCIQI